MNAAFLREHVSATSLVLAHVLHWFRPRKLTGRLRAAGMMVGIACLLVLPAGCANNTRPERSQANPPRDIPGELKEAAAWPDDPVFHLVNKDARALDLAGLSEQEAWQRLVTRVREDAKGWPGAEVKEDGRRVSISYRVREQDVIRPASKIGGTLQRRELGPEEDGVLIDVWLTDGLGQAMRPQILSSDPWRTYLLDEVAAARPKMLLNINVRYGRTTDRRRLEQFVNPTRWLAEAPSATQPATRPASARLEFRIAPNAVGSSRQPVLGPTADAVKELAEKGPSPSRQRGDEFQWFEIAADVQLREGTTAEFQGRKYILLCGKAPFVMLTGEGKEAWRLANVYATKDGAGKPAVGFDLDARGSVAILDLTKANINNSLAMLVDDKVIFAPTILSAIHSGMISGRFTEREVKDLVRALKRGMSAVGTTRPSTSPPEVAPGPKD